MTLAQLTIQIVNVSLLYCREFLSGSQYILGHFVVKSDDNKQKLKSYFIKNKLKTKNNEIFGISLHSWKDLIVLDVKIL